jgi:MFS family permease
MKASGKASTSPLRDSFMNPENRRLVIIALLGATAGQGVIWYTGQFYALFYLQTVLKINFVDANYIIAAALLMGTPFFIFFGWLSDKWGRKKIMMAGCIIAALSYIPIYKGMAYYSGYNSSDSSIPLMAPNHTALTILVFIQVFFVTMVYGPIAAFLVELFPTKIRYTSMSLPYHIGNGVFGGVVPLVGTYLVDKTGNILAGLYFPISIAIMTFIVGTFFIHEKRNVDLSSYE